MVLKGFNRLHPIGFVFKYVFNSSYRFLVPRIFFKCDSRLNEFEFDLFIFAATGVAGEVVGLDVDFDNKEGYLDTGRSFCSFASGMVFCVCISDAAPTSLKCSTSISGAFFTLDYFSSSIHGPFLGD